MRSLLIKIVYLVQLIVFIPACIVPIDSKQASRKQNPDGSEGNWSLPEAPLSSKLFEADIQRIKRRPITPETLPSKNSEFEQLFETSPQTANLMQWLDERVNYIIPFSESTYPLSDADTINMFNVGASQFLRYPINHRDFTVAEGVVVRVTTPRVGILMIGPAILNPSLSPNPHQPTAISNSFHRAKTLFHEARHSDGNGYRIGFQHETCPAYHTYEGDYACDDNSNGPYTIGALTLSYMIAVCGSDCSYYETYAMQLTVADNLDRVTSTAQWDPTPIATFTPPNLFDLFRQY